ANALEPAREKLQWIRPTSTRDLDNEQEHRQGLAGISQSHGERVDQQHENARGDPAGKDQQEWVSRFNLDEENQTQGQQRGLREANQRKGAIPAKVLRQRADLFSVVILCNSSAFRCLLGVGSVISVVKIVKIIIVAVCSGAMCDETGSNIGAQRHGCENAANPQRERG